MTAEFRRDHDGKLFLLVLANTQTEETMLTDVAAHFGIKLNENAYPVQGTVYAKETP